jgi:hypothetical protein
MMRPNFANWFWKSACSIRRISDPPQGAMTFLMDTAKRYRVDTEKLQKAVAQEFAAKREKKTIKRKGRKVPD